MLLYHLTGGMSRFFGSRIATAASATVLFISEPPFFLFDRVKNLHMINNRQSFKT